MAVARKTVTVLFADVADSTGLGERLDPESVRSALARWFEAARGVIERHGGTVEKFIGDAVMAVFGVPQLHEDDALRAVRAANELRTALGHLNDELERERGMRLAVRIGVNTGEVVAGGAEGTLVTGDAVNSAKRLEEAAPAGEVVVGETTRVLASASASFEPLEPILAKGKSERLQAWRLVSVDSDGAPFERRLDTPLVGRTWELEQLRHAYARAVHEQTCYLFTLLGPAGIGKSRLAQALFTAVSAESTVLVGRCLAYGKGITFWPLTEVLREAGGEDAVVEVLGDSDDAQLVSERLRGVTGRASVGNQETFWAVRRVFETLGRIRPLVLCFEDVHWAEPTFLDLIEYLAGWIRDTPILLLCLARPEFLDERPTWLSAPDNAASLTLQPLSEAESQDLLDALGTTNGTRARIAEAAEGNPLYVEQMAAMVAEGGYREGMFSMPPSINALLSARLDRLFPPERRAIECASVAGKEFWRDAVVELTPESERADVGRALLSLVRKDLIRPHFSTTRPDDAFRFAHVLIRDAAYAAIPKETRADLHERFADWLERISGAGEGEFDEILGYHLEQAFRCREQLGVLDGRAHPLARRAGELLGGAGARAFARGDMPAAVNLLARAAALLDEDHPVRVQALHELGSALMRTGDFAGADTVLSDALAGAVAAGDKRLELRTLIEREFFRAFTNPEGSTEELVHVAEAAIPLLEELEDELGLAKAWWLRSEADVIAGRWAARADALERAIEHSRRTGDRRDEPTLITLLAQALAYGPTPVPEAIRRCEELRKSAPDDAAVDAAISSTLAVLGAMQGDFDESRRLCAHARELYEQLGPRFLSWSVSLAAASVDLLAGDPEAAARELRAVYDRLEQMGERGVRSTMSAFLAQALVAAGRYEEALEFAEIGEQTGADADVVTQAVARSARAAALARRGQIELAEQVAREAVALSEGTDFLDLQADSLLGLADVLRIAGVAQVVPLVKRARALYARKGNLVAERRAAGLLAEPVA